jgi:uncharacterized protein YbaR (Trm112 family)
MKPAFTEMLRCPACLHDHAMALHATAGDEREAREGMLECGACGAAFELHRGVPELLHDPPGHVVTEAAGLERFAAPSSPTPGCAARVRTDI